MYKRQVYFKANQADALTAAFKEYTKKDLTRSTRPSLLIQLHKFKELAKSLGRDRVKNKDCLLYTSSAGKVLFSIPDNGLLCLFYGNGDRHFAVCHRLDDTHAEIDGVNYSLPDFAKRMKHNQISFAPA